MPRATGPEAEAKRQAREALKAVAQHKARGEKDAEAKVEKAETVAKTLDTEIFDPGVRDGATLSEVVEAQRVKNRHAIALETLYMIGFQGVMPTFTQKVDKASGKTVTVVVKRPIMDDDLRTRAQREFTDRVMGRASQAERVEEDRGDTHLNNASRARANLAEFEELTNEFNDEFNDGIDDGDAAGPATGDIPE